MNAEQKRRAERILSEWHDGKYSAARHGVEMASLLHELVDAAEEFESLTRNEDGTVSLKPGFKAVAYTAQEVLAATNPAQISSLEPAPSVPEQPADLPTWENGDDPLVGGGLISRGVVDFAALGIWSDKPAAPSVPDGWRPVPLSATVEMRNAGRAHLTGITSYADSMALKVYGAMVAAAPTPPEPASGHLEIAKHLAVSIWRKHYQDEAPEWEPLNDLAGLLSQIDNMVAGLVKPPADVVRDAERYRWLRDKCRATGEHWGGRWSLVIEGPCPDGDESSGAIDKAIDAAIKRQGGE